MKSRCKWTKKTHVLYPEEIKSVAFTLLLSRQRKDTLFHLLPRDILHLLIEILARNYDPKDEVYEFLDTIFGYSEIGLSL